MRRYQLHSELEINKEKGEPMKLRKTISRMSARNWLLSLTASTCLLLGDPAHAEPAQPFTSAAQEQAAGTKGVVLISANWGRSWGCGRNDYAQLQLLGFDKIEPGTRPLSQRPELVIEGAESGNAQQIPFSNYAFLVDPGEYEFSLYLIHVARSMTQTAHFSGDRKSLFQDGRSKVGSFKVGAGEIVYVGHFALDCVQAPMPWRFYPETRADFTQYLDKVKQQYPDLDTSKAVFRLFETKLIGKPYVLP